MADVADSVVPVGFRENALGHLVPVGQIREQDLLRDEVVCRVAAHAKRLNGELAEFKRGSLADIVDLVVVSAERYGAKVGGDKGNVTLSSFDGRFRLVRSMAAVITFTEELQAAKALIEACIERWSDGADARLKSLVMRAFKPNAQGELRTAAVLSLLRLEMQDDEWARAMGALRDSIQASGTTVYLNVYERVGATGLYRHIPLDLAAVG
ncbi:DUF3164 family protein [Candidatus Thiothrix sp. Deng01]|uniref:DUF3164 family protein n=1 Tax=Candidatus Thiothrix phosphatis TaxID=3112415 RepID=A0ABU6CZ56_9GAMM|nr:DUF3164 family protein [Candidatus Thiothrix sp. Deng01]MEB4591363.1 DUF3164 family protein [Candidatus Thiothrix sp. Deng01]